MLKNPFHRVGIKPTTAAVTVIHLFEEKSAHKINYINNFFPKLVTGRLDDSFATRGNEIFNIFISFGVEAKRGFMFSHSTSLNASRIRRKAWSRMS